MLVTGILQWLRSVCVFCFMAQLSATAGPTTCPCVGMTSKHTETLAWLRALALKSFSRENAKSADLMLDVSSSPEQFLHRALFSNTAPCSGRQRSAARPTPLFCILLHAAFSSLLAPFGREECARVAILSRVRHKAPSMRLPGIFLYHLDTTPTIHIFSSAPLSSFVEFFSFPSCPCALLAEVNHALPSAPKPWGSFGELKEYIL